MLLLYLFGLKSDAVPGRLNQYHVILIDWYLLWTMFELCGVNHGLCHYKSLLLNSITYDRLNKYTHTLNLISHRTL